MTLTPKRGLASLPTGETINEATQDDWRAAYREHEENEKLGPATMTAEEPRHIWLDRDHEFNEAVVLLRAYLRQRGYKIGGR